LIALAVPAGAAVVHDESADGDLSTNNAAPTALAFVAGGNTIIGTTGNFGGIDRDYITFTIAPGQLLIALNMPVYTPENLGFAAFNAGTASHVPSAGTAALFLAGIHTSGTDAGTDILPLFVSSSVTGNSLPSAQLGPGDYCFVIQQTSAILTSYELEFVIEQTVPTENATWGAVKALYE
jgi:hypothetical protein